ncbi:MAG: hypothetical protein OHK0046_39160 [Anaerolineae bacterium]
MTEDGLSDLALYLARPVVTQLNLLTLTDLEERNTSDDQPNLRRKYRLDL